MINSMKQFDYLSHPPKLFFNGEKRASTTVGGFMTIITVLVSFIVFGLFIKPFMNNEKFSSSINNIYEKYSNYTVNEETFPLSVFLHRRDLTKYADGSRLYYFKACQEDFTFQNLTTGGTKLTRNQKCKDMVKCTPESFGSNFPYFEASRWSEGSCLDTSDPDYYRIENPSTNGAYDFSHLTFYLFQCENSTLNNNSCYPQEVINQQLNTFYFHIDSLDHYVDNNDYNQPVKSSRITVDFPSGLDKHLTANLRYQFLYYSTDNGWLFEQKSKFTNLALMKEEYFIEENINNYIFKNELASISINFNTRGLNVAIDRKYVKLQEVIASIGGILKLLLILTVEISQLYSNYSILEHLLDLTNKKKQNKIGKRERIENISENSKVILAKFNTIKQLNTIKINQGTDVKTTKSTMKTKTFKKEEKSYFKLSLAQVICLSKIKREDRLGKSLSKLLDYLDIRNILFLTKAVKYMIKGNNYGEMLKKKDPKLFLSSTNRLLNKVAILDPSMIK
jgi:hypothetical protein